MTSKSERHLGRKNRLTSGRYFSYIFSWRAAFRLSRLLVTQDSIQSSGLAAALSSRWSRVWLMKGISDSSCSREASCSTVAGDWTPIAVLIWYWGWQEGGDFLWVWLVFFLVGCGFFPSRIILASSFLVFIQFAKKKKELHVVQQNVHVCIIYFHLNAAEF